MNVISMVDYRLKVQARTKKPVHATPDNDLALFQSFDWQADGELVFTQDLVTLPDSFAAQGGQGARTVPCLGQTDSQDHFSMRDGILSALVVPVAVRLQSLDKGELVIFHGVKEPLNALARVMAQRAGVRQVLFDSRLYEGVGLRLHGMQERPDFWWHLRAQEECPDGGPRFANVRSQVQPQWKLVYFLGVEVTEPGAMLSLNEDQTQRDLWVARQYPERALSSHAAVARERRVSLDARCFGIWYLSHGLRVGDEILRRKFKHY